MTPADQFIDGSWRRPSDGGRTTGLGRIGDNHTVLEMTDLRTAVIDIT